MAQRSVLEAAIHQAIQRLAGIVIGIALAPADRGDGQFQLVALL